MLCVFLQVFIITAVGVLVAKVPTKDPLLDTSTIQRMSRATNYLFLPALICSSLGAQISSSKMRQFAPLLIANVMIHLLCYLFALVAEKVLPVEPRLWKGLKVAMTFQNAGSLPLLLMEAICEQPLVADEFDDSKQCFETATSIIFVFLIPFHLFFYCWGFWKLGEASDLEIAEVRRGLPPRGHIVTTSVHQIPSTLAAEMKRQLSYSVASSSALMSAGHGQMPQSDADAANAAISGQRGGVGQIEEGEGVVEVSFRVATPSSEDGCEREIEVNFSPPAIRPPAIQKPGLRGQLLRLIQSPANVAVVVGVIIGLIPWLQNALFYQSSSPLRPLGGAMQTIGLPAVPLNTLIMAASLAVTQSNLKAASSASAPARRRTGMGMGVGASLHMQFVTSALVFVVGKLIAIPAIGFGVFLLLRGHMSFEDAKEDRLMQLVLLLELAMPSAQLVLVTLNHWKLQAMAGAIARLYIYQYAASIVTITMGAWLALSVVFSPS
jgi:predicted permease